MVKKKKMNLTPGMQLLKDAMLAEGTHLMKTESTATGDMKQVKVKTKKVPKPKLIGTKIKKKY